MADLKHISGMSRRFRPSNAPAKRLGELEKYTGQQSRELYVRLSHMEKRLVALERKVASIETADGN